MTQPIAETRPERSSDFKFASVDIAVIKDASLNLM
jgi:hypothetical protein